MSRSRRTLLLAGLIGLVAAAPAAAAPPTFEFGVFLKPRSMATLTAFVEDVNTPGNVKFGKYLARGEFGEHYGPTPAAVTTVKDALTAKGLTPGDLPDNSLILPVKGVRTDAEAAFGSGLNGASGLPHAAAEHIAVVWERGEIPSGDSWRPGPTTSVVDDPAVPAQFTPPSPCQAARDERDHHHASAWLFDEIATAYDFTSLRSTTTNAGWGVGVDVALIEWEPLVASDISTFQSCYGTAAQVSAVNIDGGPTGSVTGEAVLDIEVVAALAPGANVSVYQAHSGGGSQLDTYAQIAADDTADVISISYGGCEDAHAGMIEFEGVLLAQMAAQGQTFMSAAGDSGSEQCAGELGVANPPSQPYVLAVGGTSMSAIGAPPATRPTESVWNEGPTHGAGGGGISERHVMPSWQAGPGVISSVSSGTPCHAPTGTYCRQVPDVSALADPHTGYITYRTKDGTSGWGDVGGTSAASPLWAAMTASMLSTTQCAGQRFGLLAARLYPLAASTSGSSAFNDITVGDNDRLGTHPGFYDATAGYDMASGLGSPAGGGLLAALCPVVPPLFVGDPLGAHRPAEPEEERVATPDPERATAPVPAPGPAPALTAPVAPTAPAAVVAGNAIQAASDGRMKLGVRCPAGERDCRVDVRVHGKGMDLRLRNRRVEAGERRALGLRLPERLRGRDRVALKVTITSRTADGQTATVTERIVVRTAGRG